MTTPISDKDLAAKVYSKNPGQFEFALSLDRLEHVWGACEGGRESVEMAAVAAGVPQVAARRALPLAELAAWLPIHRTHWMLAEMFCARATRPLTRAILGDLYLALSVRFKEQGVRGALRDAAIIGREFHRPKEDHDALAAVYQRQYASWDRAIYPEYLPHAALKEATNEEGRIDMPSFFRLADCPGMSEKSLRVLLGEIIRLRVRPQVDPAGEAIILKRRGA